MPRLPRDIEATIKFLTAEEGGRNTPIWSGYRGQFHYVGDDGVWDAPHEYPDVEKVMPGDSVRAYLAFMSPMEHLNRIKVGLPFEIREGYRLIGNGVVTKIIDLPESANRNEANET